MPVTLCTISRQRMADLHCDREWERFTQAYRAYELPASPDELLLYTQSAMPIDLLRVRFFLPRLQMTSMDRMMAALLDRPGMIGECVFMGGFFTRALRRPAADLIDQFEAVADQLQHQPPPAPPASPVRDVVDLTLEPDTPDVVGPLRATGIDSTVEVTCMETPFAPYK